MSSVLNGRLKRGHRGRTSFENAVSRLDIQEMIQQALDERHATHQSGECWCVDDDPVPVKRESERRLHIKDAQKPSPVREHQVISNKVKSKIGTERVPFFDWQRKI